MLQNIGITQVHAQTRHKMAPTTRFTYYRSPEGQTFAGVSLWNESFVLLVSIDFPNLSLVYTCVKYRPHYVRYNIV